METKEEKAARNVVGATHSEVVGKRRYRLGSTPEGFTSYADIELEREWWEAYPPHAPSWRTTDGREITERYELSICGEIRDYSKRGEASWVSGGQCLDYPLADAEPHAAEIVALWRRWHLNGLRAGCAHQGNPEGLDRKVTRYHWRLNSETLQAQSKLERRVMGELRLAGTVTVTVPEGNLLRLPFSVATWIPEAPSPDYKPAELTGYSRPSEEIRLGSLRPDDHPEGLLCKPCPTCGYKYGSAWLTEELPADVLARVLDLVRP